MPILERKSFTISLANKIIEVLDQEAEELGLKRTQLISIILAEYVRDRKKVRVTPSKE